MEAPMWIKGCGIAVVLALVVPSIGRPQATPKPCPAADAATMIGRRATIEGTVAGVRETPQGDIWLDLERKSPRQAMSVVVPERMAKGIAELKHYKGRRIVATGLVERIQGVIRIQIDDPSQLIVVAEPDRIPCDG
jgi:hypothetical protein